MAQIILILGVIWAFFKILDLNFGEYTFIFAAESEESKNDPTTNIMSFVDIASNMPTFGWVLIIGVFILLGGFGSIWLRQVK